MPQTVDGRGIDPVDARVNGMPDRRNGFVIVDRPPAELPWTTDRPRTEAHRRNVRPVCTELPELHTVTSPFSLAVEGRPLRRRETARSPNRRYQEAHVQRLRSLLEHNRSAPTR